MKIGPPRGVWLCQDHLSLSAPSGQQTSGEGKVQSIAAAFEHPCACFPYKQATETSHMLPTGCSHSKVSSYPPDLTALSSANPMCRISYHQSTIDLLSELQGFYLEISAWGRSVDACMHIIACAFWQCFS